MQVRSCYEQPQAASCGTSRVPLIVVARSRLAIEAIANKKLCHFVPVFVTMRRVSFNIHPWPYVKFM
jgi:hypothetical protein